MTDAKSTPNTRANSLDCQLAFGRSKETYAFLVIISARSMSSTYMTTRWKQYFKTRCVCSKVLLFHNAVKLADEK